MIETLERQLAEQTDQMVADLQRLIAQPSISATGDGVRAYAELLGDVCIEYGFDDFRIASSPGLPSLIARAYVDHEPTNDAPTLLIYGHLDTQPVDEDAWDSPPFEPTLIDQDDGDVRIHARGAGDNKGNHFPHVCAVRLLRDTGGLPINVTLFMDGEEEIGSPNIEHVVEANADVLKADHHFAADGSVDESGRPVVTLGSRGIVQFEITARAAEASLHSGHWGGFVPNPAWDLVRLLDSMQDEAGRITVDGFYDDVREMTDRERAALADIPLDEAAIMEEYGLERLATGPGETPLENTVFYPLMNLSGLSAGFTGEGFQNAVPSTARAKFDVRLVVDQDPDDTFRTIVDHIEARQSDAIDYEVRQHSSRAPDRAPLDTPMLEPVAAALRSVWDSEPIVYPTTGASGPSDVIYHTLDLPYVGVGYANSDLKQHSPDESMSVRCFVNGIRSSALVYYNVVRAENSP